MEASTTIKQMLAGNRISVPAYQRAYSWDTEFEKGNLPKQVNIFFQTSRNIIEVQRNHLIILDISFLKKKINQLLG